MHHHPYQQPSILLQPCLSVHHNDDNFDIPDLTIPFLYKKNSEANKENHHFSRVQNKR